MKDIAEIEKQLRAAIAEAQANGCMIAASLYVEDVEADYFQKENKTFCCPIGALYLQNKMKGSYSEFADKEWEIDPGTDLCTSHDFVCGFDGQSVLNHSPKGYQLHDLGMKLRKEFIEK